MREIYRILDANFNRAREALRVAGTSHLRGLRRAAGLARVRWHRDAPDLERRPPRGLAGVVGRDTLRGRDD